MAHPIVILPIAHQLFLHAKEHADRLTSYEAARRTADALRKPLLNVGCGTTHFLSHPCGDVCIDVDPKRLIVCRSRRPTVGDVRSIPYPDRSFGAALCCHVLEHLPTVADAQRALSELFRVADYVYVRSPSRLLAIAWIHPDHPLWVDHLPDGMIRFEPRCRGPACGESYLPLVQRIWNLSDAVAVAAATGIPAGQVISAPTSNRGSTR